MANCINNQLTADILTNCEAKIKAGLETDVVLINYNDVDWQATTFDANNPLLCTNLALKTGKTGYKLQGVKQTNKAYFEKAEDDFGSGYKHKFSGLLLNPTAENRLQLYKLLNDDRYVVVVERKWKGEDDKDAFLLLGRHNGLVGKVHTYGSADNNGAETFEMDTLEGELERYPAMTLLETDYNTTKTAFDNKFSA